MNKMTIRDVNEGTKAFWADLTILGKVIFSWAIPIVWITGILAMIIEQLLFKD